MRILIIQVIAEMVTMSMNMISNHNNLKLEVKVKTNIQIKVKRCKCQEEMKSLFNSKGEVRGEIINRVIVMDYQFSQIEQNNRQWKKIVPHQVRYRSKMEVVLRKEDYLNLQANLYFKL